MKNFGFAIWIGDPSESDAKRQAFRPQPMGLCLQGRPRQPNGADSNNSGLAVPARFYVCGLHALPLSLPAFMRKGEQTLMKIGSTGRLGNGLSASPISKIKKSKIQNGEYGGRRKSFIRS